MEINGLRKTCRSVVAVDGVDLRVLERPDSGTITVVGAMTSLPRRQLRLVMQDGKVVESGPVTGLLHRLLPIDGPEALAGSTVVDVGADAHLHEQDQFLHGSS